MAEGAKALERGSLPIGSYFAEKHLVPYRWCRLRGLPCGAGSAARGVSVSAQVAGTEGRCGGRAAPGVHPAGRRGRGPVSPELCTAAFCSCIYPGNLSELWL